MLAIVDLGYGNIGSIGIAFERLGAAPVLTSRPDEIDAADHVVLPGVGAAGFAMGRIGELGLGRLLGRLTQPLLGICLGMQLLFERSEENDTPCLGLIPGTVRKLRPEPGLPVPHMGWSRLRVREPGSGLSDGDYAYFAHSFACAPGPLSIADADHGRPIAAAVRKDNLFGCQFHPERSGAAGARFLRAFLDS
jgi:imidazole glycerol-phosphate synthase subunit HisH